MSPVSRGRKPKKPAQKKRRPLPGLVLAPPKPLRRGRWFDAAVENVLSGAEALLTVSTARELEQRTAELLGAELYRVTNENEHHLYFGEWFQLLAQTAAGRRNGEDDAPSRLLRGMTMLAPHRLRQTAELVNLGPFPQPRAIGDVWRLDDVYGSRVALMAGYEYPDEDLPVVFLFDVRADDIPVQLVEPALHADLDHAVAAWRSAVGDLAVDAEPRLVHDSEDLEPLGQLIGEHQDVFGTESRAVMDNWFRAVRRLEDLAGARTDRGEAFPGDKYLYRDFDIEPFVDGFAAWHSRRHGVMPDIAAVEALAEDWMEGVLPQVWHSVSPVRIEAQLGMFKDDWHPDDALTPAAMALFPEWVRWNAEQAGLPDHLADQAVRAATAAWRMA